MSSITYSLKGGQATSNNYYEKAERLSNKVILDVSQNGKKYLQDFMEYIGKNKVEELRTKEEYAVELLFIGVILMEYSEYAYGFNHKWSGVFKGLNSLRNKEKIKEKVDIIKGRAILKALLKKKKIKELDLDLFKKILSWLGCTGDFKEEVFRLNIWMEFLSEKDPNYVEKFLSFAFKEGEYLLKEGQYYLGEYISGVKDYLGTYELMHRNKEDIIYCGKGEIQYIFNMVCAEILNKVYKEKFLRCKEKLVFAPACMKQTLKQCPSLKEKFGYVCKRCSKECNINKLTTIGKNLDFKVYVIPHETNLLNAKREDNEKIGIIGIACVLNLISGGWKALRLGFIPQCAILEECGCSNHWLKESKMTAINEERLSYIVKG